MASLAQKFGKHVFAPIFYGLIRHTYSVGKIWASAARSALAAAAENEDGSRRRSRLLIAHYWGREEEERERDWAVTLMGGKGGRKRGYQLFLLGKHGRFVKV